MHENGVLSVVCQLTPLSFELTGGVSAGSKSGIDSASENIYITSGYAWSKNVHGYWYYGYSFTNGYTSECEPDIPDTCFWTTTYSSPIQHNAVLYIPTSWVTQVKLLSYGEFLGI